MRYNNQDLLDPGNQMIGLEGFGGCTVKQYQDKLLDILIEIERLCTKYKITYFLMYGSLIGAVRHHGFIPWDDDADIILTRENYNRLKEVCQAELSEEYDFISYREKNGGGYTFSRIRKKDSTYIIKSEVSKHGRNAGIYIDIMTLDYLSDNKIHAFFQKRALLGLHRLVSPGFCQGVEHLIRIEDAFWALVRYLIGRQRAIVLAEKILSSAKEKKSSHVISNYLIQNRLEMHIFNKAHFLRSKYVPFEGIELPVPMNAISLINFCYYKGNIKKHFLLESKYENEHEAIIKGDYHRYNDIMFIPRERSRNTHLEVVFDTKRNSTYYDDYYLTRINKRQNDKCAIKERHYKEKAAKYLAVMNKNENTVRLCCKELQIRELLSEINYEDIIDLDLAECVRICDGLIKMDVVLQEYLPEEVMCLCSKILLKCSYIAYACRIIQKTQYLYPSDKTGKQKEMLVMLEDHLSGYYAIFEENEADLEEYLRKYAKDKYLLANIIRGICLFREADYVQAEKEFLRIIEFDENVFFAYYYLAKIALKERKGVEEAKAYLSKSLDTTTYMPLLQMALDEIKKIDHMQQVD